MKVLIFLLAMPFASPYPQRRNGEQLPAYERYDQLALPKYVRHDSLHADGYQRIMNYCEEFMRQTSLVINALWCAVDELIPEDIYLELEYLLSLPRTPQVERELRQLIKMPADLIYQIQNTPRLMNRYNKSPRAGFPS